MIHHAGEDAHAQTGVSTSLLSGVRDPIHVDSLAYSSASSFTSNSHRKSPRHRKGRAMDERDERGENYIADAAPVDGGGDALEAAKGLDFPAEKSVNPEDLTEGGPHMCLNSFCIGFRMNDDSLLNPEFAKHLFRSGPLRAQIIKTANGVTRINVSKVRLAKILIPLPPTAEQERIARILDQFEALTGDLHIGLPAEIAARRKQYEHYRDRLLTFEEAAA